MPEGPRVQRIGTRPTTPQFMPSATRGKAKISYDAASCESMAATAARRGNSSSSDEVIGRQLTAAAQQSVIDKLFESDALQEAEDVRRARAVRLKQIRANAKR